MFTKRINDLLLENDMYRADIVRGTGIGESTIRGWYKGNKPSAESLYKVAQFFGVTVEWLLTGENESTNKNQMFTKEERELIEIFRHLDDRDKNAILTMAQSLESQYSNSKTKDFSAG